MNQSKAIIDRIDEFMESLNDLPRSGQPSEKQLKDLADKLVFLAGASAWEACPYREAVPGEELLYELAVSSNEGPSLYLVSDGPTVISPPHEHTTWAVIAGIRGRETNRLYARQSNKNRLLVESSNVDVGPGEFLILGAQDIHATEVHSREATFHLHLYGRPLYSLPTFVSRCFSQPEGA